MTSQHSINSNHHCNLDPQNMEENNQLSDSCLFKKLLQLEQSVVELQMVNAFLENTIDTLNQIVTQQSLQLTEQQRQLQLIYRKMLSNEQGNNIQPFDLITDKPPHY